MRDVRSLCAAIGIAAFVFMSPAARADEFNKRTYFTISAPVQIPGATLPAGRYMFIMANPETSMDILRVTSADGKTVYGMFPVRPDRVPDPVKEPTIVFAETPAGQPYAIKSWFYPGRKIGQELVYPKTQAMKIAKATGTPMLTVQKSGRPASADNVSRVDAKGRVIG
jgi:hypothetical protein